MKVGFHNITPEIAVSFDNEKEAIIVSKYIRPIPGFKGDWQEVATFTDETSWEASEFAKLLTNEYLKDMIMWFWFDVQETCKQPTE